MSTTPPTLPGLHLSEDLELPIGAVTETIAILAKRGSGKALAIDTPIATPDGWTTMGALAEGDQVFDEQGMPCTVTAAHPVRTDRPCYRVAFSDGAEIVADRDHLWLTEDLLSRLADQNAKRYANRSRGSRPQCVRRQFPALHTTEDLRATLRHGNRGDLNHAIRSTAPLSLPAVDLPIGPYTLGAWLGDGTSTAPVITTADPEIIEQIRGEGYQVGLPYQYKATNTPAYPVQTGPDGRKLRTVLRSAGLLGLKHIPPAYLRAAEPQRLALLQGLLDTDGWKEGGQACFVSTTEALADGVHELVVSLGWKARRRKRPAKLNGVEHGTAYQVIFRPDRQPFRLTRKALPLGKAQAIRHLRRMVTAVEPMASVPVRCITVDSPSRLFLAGRDMIPTHNSYAASVLAEEMISAGQQVVIIDPVGVFWGLRSSADGTSEGLPVAIFGGAHADLPLTDDAGGRIADLLVTHRVPAVLDLADLSKTAARRFVAEFCEQLYHRNRDPLHLIMDEADLFAPQQTAAAGARCLGAVQDIQRRGRARGIGTTLVTQRPAVLNKDVLGQAEVLLAMRMSSPRDVAAIDEWVRLHADDAAASKVKTSLPGLPVGTGWVWSAGWLDLLQCIRVRRRTTFDSSATPTPGRHIDVPTEFARINLDQLRADLGQPAISPDAAQLAGDLARVRAELAAIKAAPPRVQQVLPDGFVELLHDLRQLEARFWALLPAALDDGQRSDPARSAAPSTAAPAPVVAGPNSGEGNPTTIGAPSSTPATSTTARRPPRPAPPDGAPNGSHPHSGPEPDTAVVMLRAGARRMLDSLARVHPLRITRAQLATLAGLRGSGGTFNTYFSVLRRNGYLDEHDPNGLLQLTDAGRAAAGVEPTASPISAEEVRELWRSTLRAGARTMLDHLIAVHPATATRAELAAAAQLEQSGGTFSTYLSTLRRNGLVDVDGDNVRASEVFFLANAFLS